MSKNWERPWSIEEIVENAGNWTLAGDAGLLKCIESLSEKIISQSQTTIENVDKMMDNLNTTSVNLDLVKNKFFSLQNTQFIESRVYEDDEVLDSTVEEKKVNNQSINEEEKKNAINNAILKGIEILDKYYDKVSVPASDSEDDEDYAGSFILRPKDPYLHRPLPYIIGTEEWHKKWHVGLEDSSSDSEVEKVVDSYSESDSDDNLPVTDRRNLSNSDSGTDISGPLIKPVANSTLAETLVSSDSEDNNGSISAQVPVSNSTFADELSSKLGSIIQNAHGNSALEVNKKPLRKGHTHSKVLGDFMSDQPPPLDDSDDGLFERGKSQGMFSGGQGLFDDSDDEGESIWNTKIPEKPVTAKEEKQVKIPNLFDDDFPEEETVSNVSKPKTTQKSSIGGLFDDELEDDLFSTATNKTQTSRYKFDDKYVPSFIENEPPEIIEEKKPLQKSESSLNKEPIKPGAFLPKRRQSSSESSTEEEINPPSTFITKENNIKSTGLFGDSEDLFKDDLFTNVKQESTKSPPNNNKVDVLSTQSDFTSKKISLFDDEEESDDLFSEVNLSKGKIKIDNISQRSDDKSQENVLKPTSIDVITPQDFQADATSKLISLFDDSSDEDLFATTTNLNRKKDEVQPPVPSTDFNFYNVQPPELDDWDTKSENNLFDDEDEIYESNSNPTQVPEVSLFDKEPPSLDFNNTFESTQGGTKSNIPKLFDDEPSNLDVNFESPKPKSRSNFADTTLPKLNEKDLLFTEDFDGANDKLPEFLKGNENKAEFAVPQSADKVLIVPESSLIKDDNFMLNEPVSKDTTDHHQIPHVKEIHDSPIKRVSPGKIKHNLNINVAALMPGSTLPKKKDLLPSKTLLEEEPIIQNNSTESANENFVKVTVNEKFTSKENDEKNNNGNVETLYNINKFRAKGSQRRRPSTRRARQELLKKSKEEEEVFDDAGSSNTQNDNAKSDDAQAISANQIVNINKTNNENKSNPPKSEQKPIATKHDIFKDREDQFDIFAQKSKPDPKKVDLFDDLYDDADIFNSNDKNKLIINDNINPKIHATNIVNKPSSSLPVSKKINLFDDDDDEDDDIFSKDKSAAKIKPSSSIFSEDVSKKKVLGKKGSLFGDGSDEDDIFTSNVFVKKEIKSTNIISKAKKVASNSEVLNDPLDALNK